MSRDKEFDKLSPADKKFVKDESQKLEGLYKSGKPLSEELNKITKENYKDLSAIVHKMQRDEHNARMNGKDDLPQVSIMDYEQKQPSKLVFKTSEKSSDTHADQYNLDQTKDGKKWSHDNLQSNLLWDNMMSERVRNWITKEGNALKKYLGHEIERGRNQLFKAVRGVVPNPLNPAKQVGDASNPNNY